MNEIQVEATTRLIHTIFPNLKEIEAVKRAQYWKAHIIAFFIMIGTSFFSILVLSAVFKNWFVVEAVYNLILIYIYIRVAGHTLEGRAIDSGLFERETIHKLGYTLLTIYAFAPFIADWIIGLTYSFFILLFLFFGAYPSSKKSN